MPLWIFHAEVLKDPSDDIPGHMELGLKYVKHKPVFGSYWIGAPNARGIWYIANGVRVGSNMSPLTSS